MTIGHNAALVQSEVSDLIACDAFKNIEVLVPKVNIKTIK